MKNKIWIGITTFSSEKEGKLMAQNLITNNLAACVNIIPKINSFFYWEGKFSAEKEFLLLIKTTGERVKEVMNKIKQGHSYQVPEIIFWPIEEVDKDYGQWVKETVNPPRKKIKKS
ncbi:MAG: divalent-cation tolerance protein CutA [Thermodesulfobacteriota bacterium]